MAFSPDGLTLAAAGRDGLIRFFDIAAGTDLSNAKATHRGGASCVAFSPDGKTVVSGGFDGSVQFWQVEGSRTVPPEIPRMRIGAQGRLHSAARLGGYVLAIAFAPDGKTLAAAHSISGEMISAPGSIAIVNARSRQVVARLDGHLGAVNALAFAPDGKTLASGGSDRSIRLWDWKTRDATGRAGWAPGRREIRATGR